MSEPIDISEEKVVYPPAGEEASGPGDGGQRDIQCRDSRTGARRVARDHVSTRFSGLPDG